MTIPKPRRTAHIDLAEAQAALESAPGEARSVALFRNGTLQVKLYAPRGHDPQTPHTCDEVYIVAEGHGVFFDGEARWPFAPGTFLFAGSGRPHRFEDFSDDLAVWVFYYGPEGGELEVGSAAR